MSRPAKAPRSGFRILTASSNVTSPRSSRRCALLAHALANRRRDDLTLLAATVTLALLGNAFICGVISGPHDRFGARMVWLATFVVLTSLSRYLGGGELANDTSGAA